MPGLVLVGASGLAREVASAVQASGSHRLVGVVDDDESRWGQPFAGVRVIGGLDVLGSIGPAELLLCPGKGASRRTLAGRIAHLGQRPRRYATIVHPRASVGSTCTVGAGSVLLAGVVLTSDVPVG